MTLRIVLASGLALTLAGCGGLELQRAQGLEPSGSEFTQQLYAGYIARSESEYGEADYRDSDQFALRARRAAVGEDVMPEEISARRLPADEEPALSDSRQRLVAALDGGGRERFPDVAATAQVSFDCWMQEQEENNQPEHIAACRNGFDSALAELETALAPVAAAEPRTFVVYFDFNDATLTDEANSKLAEATAYVDEFSAASVTVEGHTDLAGSDQYNDRLAQIRAELVANALRDRGLDASLIEQQEFGEAKPAVATPDGTPEAMNRRVEVTVTAR